MSPGNSNRTLVILETDWSQDGGDDSIRADAPVGPDHAYRDVFGAAAGLFDARIDYAQFAAPEGFAVLLRRFASKNGAAPWLVVTGHGSPKRLQSPGGTFDPWTAISDALPHGRAHHKKGLLFSACSLAKLRTTAESLLESGSFEWISGYRGTTYGLSGVLTELCFWRTFFDGWRWKKVGIGTRVRSAPGAKPGDPLAAALLTNLEIASSVASRFDVKVLNGGEVVSSLEIFSHLATVHFGWPAGLRGVKPTSASKVKAEEYRDLFKNVWSDNWTREVQS